MDIVALVAGSAIVSRNVVEELKALGYLKNRVAILAATLVINIVIALVDAYLATGEVSVPLATAVISTVMAALYNDLRNSFAR